MSKDKYPVTPAIRMLRDHNVTYEPHLYEYEAHGGTAVAARALQVAEHAMLKTIVLEDDRHRPLIFLQHGDKEISAKNLARFLNVKAITPCRPEVATRHTGYLVGGTSPFGVRHPEIAIYMERSILALDRVYINGGKRGFLVCVAPMAMIEVLKPTLVDAATA